MRIIISCLLAVLLVGCATTPPKARWQNEDGTSKELIVLGVGKANPRIGAGVDLTPGLVGVVMNAALLAGTLTDAAKAAAGPDPQLNRIYYLREGHTLLQGRVCSRDSVDVPVRENNERLVSGELVVLNKDELGLFVSKVQVDGGEVARLSPDHICFPLFKKLMNGLMNGT